MRDNTKYCNIRYRQNNVWQYSSPTIQVIAIFVTYNTMYCIDRTNQYNILLGIYCNILQYIYIHGYTTYTTRNPYVHVSGSTTLRTINYTTYCNSHCILQYFFRQYNILQYPLPTKQYIAIFVKYTTIHCFVRTQDLPTQYIRDCKIVITDTGYQIPAV